MHPSIILLTANSNPSGEDLSSLSLFLFFGFVISGALGLAAYFFLRKENTATQTSGKSTQTSGE